MNISTRKLKAIIFYFCSFTDVKYLGKVKLMKLFYFLDFIHLKKYGAPVTYDNYINLEHGPIPSGIKNIVDSAVDDMDFSVLSDTIKIEKPLGTDMCRILPAREFTKLDASYFSESELDVLQRVCTKYGDKNTKYIEDASHQESPWKKTSLLQTIPYTMACEDDDCEVSKEEIELLLGL